MDRSQKEKIAKLIVGIDDAIASSGGLAELLGRMLAFGVSSFVGADIKTTSDKADKVEED